MVDLDVLMHHMKDYHPDKTRVVETRMQSTVNIEKETVRMYVCMYVYMYVCMYVCGRDKDAEHRQHREGDGSYVRMYVCAHVCMYVCGRDEEAERR